MDCAKIVNLLDGYLDGELDQDRVTTVKRHLKVCRECGRSFAARSSIATAIQKDATYHPAPAALANRIRAQIAQSTAHRAEKPQERRFKLPEWGRWLQLGGAFATAVLVTTLATLQLASVPEDERIVSQLLDGHSRSIVTGHQIDVVSSDQHTVKPWLSSKLDFSPAVIDLTPSGFELSGGRLDYVNNRPVAVLVYRHRQHLIDLFIWPDDAATDTRVSRTFSKRGVNVLHWTAAGMTYWAVSDVNDADLKLFAERYASAR
jgi:anti-sigma factor (TIGR02949 family)